MNNIAICIPTYKRPLMLKKLILSIYQSNINTNLIKNINIIILDNDIEKTAEKTFVELKESFESDYKLHYSIHPIKGISNARNELIRRGLSFNPNFLVFIDDDEYVTTEWLNELVKTIINNNADFARGPVIRVFDDTVPEYISCWFRKITYSNNMQIDSIVTDNLILSTKSLLNFDVWFDTRFNIIGNGDSYFGIQILKKGAKIFWAADALVYETIPESRANIKWLIKRIYRGASAFTYILKLEKEYLKLIKKILVSLIYIISGIGALILMILPIKKRYWGILTLTEGIGGLTGLVNLLYKEYK